MRAELAALRANLEILFDADLSHRPAIETDRQPRLQRLAARHGNHGPGDRQPDRQRRRRGLRREHRGEPHHRRACRTPSGRGRMGVAAELRRCAPQAVGGGAGGSAHRVEEPPRAWSPQPPQPSPQPVSQAAPEPQFAWQPTQQERPPAPPPEPPSPTAARLSRDPEPEPVAQARRDGSPRPRRDEWIPAGAPGSNWVSPAAPNSSASADDENGSADEYVGRCRDSSAAAAG